MQIKRLEKDIGIINHSTVKEYLSYDGNYLFEIESNDEKYYIAASFVRVFENQLEFSESSLHKCNKDKGVEIAKSFT